MAFGALLAAAQQVDPLVTMRAMFVLYGAFGVGVWALYRGLPADPGRAGPAEGALLDASRPVVVRLALLFSVDAFAGGLVVNALLALWLSTRSAFVMAVVAPAERAAAASFTAVPRSLAAAP